MVLMIDVHVLPCAQYGYYRGKKESHGTVHTVWLEGVYQSGKIWTWWAKVR